MRTAAPSTFSFLYLRPPLELSEKRRLLSLKQAILQAKATEKFLFYPFLSLEGNTPTHAQSRGFQVVRAAFSRLRQIRAQAEDCTVLSLSLKPSISLVFSTLSTTLFLNFGLLRTNLDFFFSFFSFSWQSQMCQKKGNFYHYCQKRDSNNMPPSNTSVLFTRKKRTKSNRSLSTTQCTEIQMAPLPQHQQSGASCTLFYKDFGAPGGKEVISWFLSGIGDTKHYSHRKNRTHTVKYFQSYQASKPESQRNWGNH